MKSYNKTKQTKQNKISEIEQSTKLDKQKMKLKWHKEQTKKCLRNNYIKVIILMSHYIYETYINNTNDTNLRF